MKKPTRKRGATLLEMMFVVAFLYLIAGYVADTLVETTRIQNIAGAQYDMQRQGHHELDQMVNDIHDSQLILDSYTYNSTQYTSDNSSTIILQAPSYDASGTPLGTNDIIIYHLVGTAAPFELCRIVAPAAGSARSPENNFVVIDNAFSMTLTYCVDDDIIGDGITSIFTLSGFPNLYPSVTKNGQTLIPGRDFTYTAPQTLTFASAPAAPDALDIVYTVNPTVSPSQVSSVRIDLKIQQVSNAFTPLTVAKTQSVELASSTDLRNH